MATINCIKPGRILFSPGGAAHCGAFIYIFLLLILRSENEINMLGKRTKKKDIVNQVTEGEFVGVWCNASSKKCSKKKINKIESTQIAIPQAEKESPVFFLLMHCFLPFLNSSLCFLLCLATWQAILN